MEWLGRFKYPPGNGRHYKARGGMKPRADRCRGAGPDASADPVCENSDLVVPYFGEPAFDGEFLL